MLYELVALEPIPLDVTKALELAATCAAWQVLDL
jgi:hypothetical protein